MQVSEKNGIVTLLQNLVDDLLQTLIEHELAIGQMIPAEFRELVSEGVSKIRMNTAQHPNRPRIAKEFLQEEVSAVALRGQTVAVREKNLLSLMKNGERLMMHRHSGDFSEDPSRPPVVVAAQEGDRHAGIHDLANLRQDPKVPPGHHVRVFEPEIEQIAQDVKMLGATIRYMAQKRNEASEAALVVRGSGRGSEVSIRDEINRPLHPVLGVAMKSVETSNASSGPARERNFPARTGYAAPAQWIIRMGSRSAALGAAEALLQEGGLSL
jgi:hypothetical protein